MADERRDHDGISRAEVDATYVRKDVYAAHREAQAEEHRSILDRLLRVENKGDRNFRLAVTAFVGPIVSLAVAWWLNRGGHL